ncbi:MAG: family 10 glycosylhydrolase [Deltaproteobacteria bacterium]|nr:family 10 glycosylhydrolase [Deltaproteobacteria bacterium]
MQKRHTNRVIILIITTILLLNCGDEGKKEELDAISNDVVFKDLLSLDTREEGDFEEISDITYEGGFEEDISILDTVTDELDVKTSTDVYLEDTSLQDEGYMDVGEVIDANEDVNNMGDIITDTGDVNYEARAVWVTRWDFDKSKATGPQSIATIMKNIAEANFNMVYFQVRGRADAYYRSSYEPWAQEFTGTLGVDPGWDPLKVAIEEAHKNGLEIHAWINTFTMWSGTTPPSESLPRHIYLSHPEWLVVDSNGNRMALNSSYVFATPGNPAVWDHIINVVSEIALRYNVDGIHFDYIRYPGPNYSYDPVSNTRFNEAKSKDSSLTREDWQRSQVTEFLSRAYESIISIKPMLKVTAAVWGIYRNKWGWTNVSQGYSDYYQDSQNWMKLGIIDAISPMIYWPMTNPPGQRADYATLASDFMSNSHNRFLFAGLHVYPRNETDTLTFSEMVQEIEYLRKIGAQGMAIYNYALLRQHNYFDELRNGPFKEKAYIPPMGWK